MSGGQVKTVYYASAGVSLAGLALSIYLTLPTPLPEFCEIGTTFSCTKVIESQYSRIMGVPVAAVGAAWFLIAAILSILGGAGALGPGPLLLWGVLGVAGALVLLLVEVFLVGSICLLCTFAHAAGAVILGLSALGYLWSQPPMTSG